MIGGGASGGGSASAEELLSQINVGLSNLQLQTTVQVGKHDMAVRLSLFLLIRVLLKIVDREGDRQAREKVQLALQYCQKKHREGADPAFRSLAGSIQKLVRTVAGEKRWRQAEMACVVIMSRKKAPATPQALIKQPAGAKFKSGTPTPGKTRPSASAKAVAAHKQATNTSASSTTPGVAMIIPPSPSMTRQPSLSSLAPRESLALSQQASPPAATTTETSTSVTRRPSPHQRQNPDTKRPVPRGFETNKRQAPTATPPRVRLSSHEPVSALPPPPQSQLAAGRGHSRSQSVGDGAEIPPPPTPAATAPSKKRQPSSAPVRHVRMQSTPMGFAPPTPAAAAAALSKKCPPSSAPVRHVRMQSAPMGFAAVAAAAASAKKRQPSSAPVRRVQMQSTPIGFAPPTPAAAAATPSKKRQPTSAPVRHMRMMSTPIGFAPQQQHQQGQTQPPGGNASRAVADPSAAETDPCSSASSFSGSSESSTPSSRHRPVTTPDRLARGASMPHMSSWGAHHGRALSMPAGLVATLAAAMVESPEANPPPSLPAMQGSPSEPEGQSRADAATTDEA